MNPANKDGVYDFDPFYAASTADSYFVMAYLRDIKKMSIRDLTNDMVAQKKGIDFEAANKTVEFKSDSRIGQTGNFAIEIISNTVLAKAGSCLTSQAEYLFYYDPSRKLCHIFKLSDMWRAILKGPVRWSTSKSVTPIHRKNPDGTEVENAEYGSFCLLVPITFIKSNCQYTVYDLSEYTGQWNLDPHTANLTTNGTGDAMAKLRPTQTIPDPTPPVPGT